MAAFVYLLIYETLQNFENVVTYVAKRLTGL